MLSVVNCIFKKQIYYPSGSRFLVLWQTLKDEGGFKSHLNVLCIYFGVFDSLL